MGVGLVIAHPDDESMFFVPTIKAISSGELAPAVGLGLLYILCLSTGNADNLGKTRSIELVKAAAVLGIPEERVIIIDDDRLQDGMDQHWCSVTINQFVEGFVKKYEISLLITFDSYGVSGHPNHISVHHGVSTIKKVPILVLDSVSLPRKYSSVLDLPLSQCQSSIIALSFDPMTSYKAMSAHASQFVWYRRLFVGVSRFTAQMLRLGLRRLCSPTIDKEKSILQSLYDLKHPETGDDVTLTGMITGISIDNASVDVSLKLDTSYRVLRRSIISRVSELPWVQDVHVRMSTPDKDECSVNTSGGIDPSTSIVAVSSCKGGVGKSTVAVNLAYSLDKLGFSVGLLDADIYGPSLPSMIGNGTPTGVGSAWPIPPSYKGVSLMSYGFLSSNQKGAATALRGPMVSTIAKQLALDPHWGPLDFLIVDLPPGTGDIHLSLGQTLAFKGAVVVSTPQKVALDDVRRGQDLFKHLSVPTLALVRNMAYIKCKCGENLYPFGKPSLECEPEAPEVYELPMLAQVSESGDSGDPVVLRKESDDTRELVEEFTKLAQEVSKVHSRKDMPVHVDYLDGRLVMQWMGKEFILNPALVRRACKCAKCVDEISGKRTLDPETVSDSIAPVRITPQGNYAVAITWSDGHNSSIYPYASLAEL